MAALEFYKFEQEDNHLKNILRFLAKGFLVLVGSLPHSALKMGEQRPNCAVTVLDVAMQRKRRLRPQKTSG